MVDFPDLLADAVSIGSETNNDDGPPREVTLTSDHGDDEVDDLIDDLLSENNEYLNNKAQRFIRREEKGKESFDSSSCEKDRTQFHSVSNEIIDVEDLSERLSSDFSKESGKGFNKAKNSPTRSSDDDTSETESDYSFRNDNRAGSSGSRSSSDNEDDNSEANKSDGTQDLLDRAHDRIALQALHDEIAMLKEVIATKNLEMEHLSGQLRRAISTKCDLVLAHTELERHHEYNLQMKTQESHMLMKANFGLLENRACLEKDLMNEIVKLTREVNDTKTQRQEELDDWERMHKNAILEKDLQIAELKEELRRIKSGQLPVRNHGHNSSTGVMKGLIFQ